MNITVPLRVEAGERLFAECVAAEVTAGEAPMSPSQVRVQVTPGATSQDWIARITTVAPIEEPVVEIAISAGCEKRFMRRFTAFADPPELSVRGTALASAAQPMSVSPLASMDSLGLPPVQRRRPPSVVDRPARSAVDANSSRVATRGRPAAKRGPARPAAPPEVEAPTRRPSVVPSEAQVARLLLDVGGPRLKMDIDEPLMRVPASVMAAASGLTPPSDVSGVDDMARLQSLEKTLTELKKENRSAQEATSGMKARLAEAESRSRLLPWLLGLLVLASGLAVWLAIRLRKQARDRDGVGRQQWWASGSAPLDSMGPVPVPPPSIAGELIDEPLETPAPRPGSGVEWREPEAEEPAMQKTAAFPAPAGLGSLSGGALDGAGPTREVSVEELLDLEQQADFFIALGQEDAAVDLLMSHLRGTGGLSPLPYTKLLEIYKRQGDRGAYERIRARFNRRFNAYAPDWDVGPLQGRALEDYPEVALYLQSIWPSPIDAMAVLEGMLFRKDETQELFDLPAYKDVLLLYSLARDLWQQGGEEVTEVDVLLPLGEPVMSTSPGLETGTVQNDYDLTAFELEPRSPAPGPRPSGDDGFPELPSQSTSRH